MAGKTQTDEPDDTEKVDPPKNGPDDKGKEPETPSAEDFVNVQKALAKERADRREADKARKTAEAEVEKLSAGSKTDQERAVDAAVKTATASVMEKLATRIVLAEAHSAAASLKFHNPENVKLADLSGITVEADGTVDVDEIKKRVKELVTEQPHLVVAETTQGTQPVVPPGPRVPKPDPSQGSGRQQVTTAGLRGREEARRRFPPRT